MEKRRVFENPFRPGAGHMPLYLAGRDEETNEFQKLLAQTTILGNLILTGLRGVGKTVLLDAFKPLAIRDGWFWVGTDLSESSSISEDKIALRLLTDLSVVTSTVPFKNGAKAGIGFKPASKHKSLSFEVLAGIYNETPGLASDKLKRVLEVAWKCIKDIGCHGIVFAYDEAQNLSDHAKRHEFPLSLLLDVFQSIQKKGIPYLLIMAGLPTLFPKLVEARTYSERMFHVLFLDKLKHDECKSAILEPIKRTKACPMTLTKESLETCIKISGGYPYFIQFICREVFDVFTQTPKRSVPTEEITRKLDVDFFSGRWAKVTDRQRELLTAVAHLPNCDSEFTVQEIAEATKMRLEKPFSPSHINQILATLANNGLVYKNRYGKYSLAVPMLGQFILRQQSERVQTIGLAQLR